MNYLVVDSEGRDLVFFVDSGKATAHYPEGGTDRLLPHCSSQHLLVENHPARVPVSPSEGLPARITARPEVTVIGEDLSAAVNRLVSTIDRRVHPETAAWMAGYARITACCSALTGSARYIIASQLYIEYATHRHATGPERRMVRLAGWLGGAARPPLGFPLAGGGFRGGWV